MNILEEAIETIKERGSEYGEAKENLGMTAVMWSIILDTDVTAEDVCKCMIALKLMRWCETSNHDTILDIIGYAALGNEVNK